MQQQSYSLNYMLTWQLISPLYFARENFHDYQQMTFINEMIIIETKYSREMLLHIDAYQNEIYAKVGNNLSISFFDSLIQPNTSQIHPDPTGNGNTKQKLHAAVNKLNAVRKFYSHSAGIYYVNPNVSCNYSYELTGKCFHSLIEFLNSKV